MITVQVVPVLRVLHSTQADDVSTRPTSSSRHMSPSMTHDHHMYLALVVLLMLTEDEFFCKIIHETVRVVYVSMLSIYFQTIHNIDWYSTERQLSQITLGGLIVLVLTRTIQVNIVKVRVRFLYEIFLLHNS